MPKLDPTAVAAQFHTSSVFPYPPDRPLWKIRNIYPHDLPGVPIHEDWYTIDFSANSGESMKFLNAAKEYILSSNIYKGSADLDKSWYHLPWLHCGKSGREPTNGLMPGAPRRVSEKVDGKIQLWGNSFFNENAAYQLHKIWGDGTQPPTWNDHLHFEDGSFIFLLLFTNADIKMLHGAPEMEACISKSAEGDVGDRNNFTTNLRLIQVDFRARTSKTVRADKGGIDWVFGSFGCKGDIKITDPLEKWEKCLVPLGLQWGNNPGVDEVVGQIKPEFFWNDSEDASEIRKFYSFPKAIPNDDGKGWGHRFTGPTEANRFMSACASCHSTAQVPKPPQNEFRTFTPFTQTPQPVLLDGSWKQPHKEALTLWFRNLNPKNEDENKRSFDKDSYSADYNHGIHFGYTNYLHWSQTATKSKSADTPVPSDVLRATYGF